MTRHITPTTGQLLLIATFSLLILQTNAACPNVKGKLVGLEHAVAGTLSLKSSCSLSVSKFSYDGKAPDVYWWAAPSCNYIDIVKNGYRISNTKVSKKYKGANYSLKLKSGVNFSNAGCIILYCESFKADLGHTSF